MNARRMRPAATTFSPRPRRGELESCLIPSHHDGQLLYEVFAHPADTASLLEGIRVNGHDATVQLVDRLPLCDTLRILVHVPPVEVTDPADGWMLGRLTDLYADAADALDEHLVAA